MVAGVGNFHGAEMRRLRQEQRAYEFFSEKGKEYTQGYLEGRKGRFTNLFIPEYSGAKRALEDLTKSE